VDKLLLFSTDTPSSTTGPSEDVDEEIKASMKEEFHLTIHANDLRKEFSSILTALGMIIDDFRRVN
jgi:hypothetical protein